MTDKDLTEHTAPKKCGLKVIQLTPEFILSLLKMPKDGMLLTVTSKDDIVPENAIAIRCGLSPMGNVNLIIGDKSFDELIEGQSIPSLFPRFYTRIVTKDD